MSEITKIEWTDSTWNPITGCSVVSAGCKHCYAMKLAGTRLAHHPSRVGLTFDTKAGPVWNGEVRFNEKWLDQPLRWRRQRRIFVCAHGDLFYESVPDAWIDRVFAVMAYADHYTFQVLTKRPQRMHTYLRASPDELRQRWAQALVNIWGANDPDAAFDAVADVTFPLPNVWPCVSVENQETADERIRLLLATPAAVRGISAEPLLGPVGLCCCDGAAYGVQAHPFLVNDRCALHGTARLDWVIAGGESGKGARPMHPDWARSLRDQCATAGVAFFFKQWGEFGPHANEEHFTHCGEEKHSHAWVDGETGSYGECWLIDDEGLWSNYTGEPRAADGEDKDGEWKIHSAVSVMGRFGKKRAGRALDGVLHDAHPKASRG